MGKKLSEAFSISFDGSTKTAATITASSDDILRLALHALVKNELYIFGGYTNSQKIVKLVGCEWIEQSTTLKYGVAYPSAALTIENGEKALICFPCEVFDGETRRTTYDSEYSHDGGKLGFYKGKPTTVGCYRGDGAYKVETLNSYGWSSLTDFPISISYHVLVGLPSGCLLLAGGQEEVDNDMWLTLTAIWLLKNNNWNKIGDLHYADKFGSAIMMSNSIFIVSGDNRPHAIQRLDLEGDEVVNQEVIGNTVENWIPVVFEVSPDYCV